MVTSKVELVVAAMPGNVGMVRREIGRLASTAGATDRTVDAVQLCVTEAIANAIVHAYGGRDGTVEVAAEAYCDQLVVLVRDHGGGVPAKADAGRGAGLGLRLINSLAEHCAVQSTPGRGTQVRMTFALGRSVRDDRP